MNGVPRKALEELLTATTRPQNVNGKSIDQVESCVLISDGTTLQTLCIVKDGTTSLSKFSFALESDQPFNIPVPDISRLLGVLKFHSDVVSLDLGDEKVVVRSKGKQTTLLGGFNAKSYANSQNNLTEAQNRANKRAGSFNGDNYVLSDGSTRPPFASISLDCKELHEALRCDAINGQRLNRYTFESKHGELLVTVGDPFKGETTTLLDDSIVADDFVATFEGGLENVLKHYSLDVKLHFYNFSPEGQGIRMMMEFNNGDWVFQCGVL